MKIAQEIRVGNVVMINGEPMVVQKHEYSRSGRNSAVVKMKYKNWKMYKTKILISTKLLGKIELKYQMNKTKRKMKIQMKSLSLATILI